MSARTFVLVCAVGAVAGGLTPSSARTQSGSAAPATANPLAPLAFLVGQWRVPPGDSALIRNPRLSTIIALDVQWTVGGHALRVREIAPATQPDSAEMDGMVYWDPAQERIGFTAVAGRAAGQGRLFRGELLPLADGRVQRTYDVYYRTLADTPAEEAGGSRRRYREIWHALDADRIQHTLEWWWEGRWQPYARGRYTLVRAR